METTFINVSRTGLCNPTTTAVFMLLLFSSVSFVCDANSISSLTKSTDVECAQACNKLNYKLTKDCKETCKSGDVHHITVLACSEDKPTTVGEMRDCFEAKSDAAAPADAKSFVQGGLATLFRAVPLPKSVRIGMEAAGSKMLALSDSVGEKFSSYNRALSRSLGTSTGGSCSVVEYPLFPLRMYHFKPNDAALFQGISQPVFFSPGSNCDGDHLVLPNGDKVRASGVALLKRPMCEWPGLRPGVGIAMLSDCRPIGHIAAYDADDSTPAKPSVCFISAKHVIDKAQQITYISIATGHYPSSPRATWPTPMDVTQVTTGAENLAWKYIDELDLAYSGGCARHKIIPKTCMLRTYANGMGLEHIEFTLVRQAGSKFVFGQTPTALVSGMSGSPCFGKEPGSPWTVLVLSAVVRGGAEFALLE